MDGLDELPPIHTCGKDIEQVFFILTQMPSRRRREHGTIASASWERGEGKVQLQFVDDCGGIAPQVQERLFEPFVTTKPAGQGMGLGLCVVQRLVSQAGGHLKVDSRWGEGTIFFLTLPIEMR